LKKRGSLSVIEIEDFLEQFIDINTLLRRLKHRLRLLSCERNISTGERCLVKNVKLWLTFRADWLLLELKVLVRPREDYLRRRPVDPREGLGRVLGFFLGRLSCLS